ncbi:hypothetical protein FNH22_25055 [Fulvivirga sp. M361]|uniref:hypothetical protein n=1 Tax=Fulvivirga sp. M361 TaxID=2594266 RepID=UPI001179BEEB|nr:hypothetical protein [Fulvivirga sp. M361]TRX50924.1 hypothetical protein FNH22_25055 [Fulvivirga sp. M361]
MKYLILPFILFLIFSCQPTSSTEIIYGSWEAYKKVLRNGETGEKYTFDGKPYRTSLKFDLFEDGRGFEYSNNTEFQYSVRDSILILGNRNYIIENLDAESLILLEYNEDHPENPMAFRLFFKRSK